MKKFFIGIIIGILTTILVINIFTKEFVKNDIAPVNSNISKTNIENKKHLVSINGTFYINASKEACRKGIKLIPNLYMTIPPKEEHMVITLGSTSICGEIIPEGYIHYLENFRKLTLKQQGALGTLLIQGYLDTPEYKKHLNQQFNQ